MIKLNTNTTQLITNTTQITGPELVRELEERIALYSRVPHHVLITGERGTGKTTIAKRLHEQSTREKKEFVNLNCATLSESLLESELFGYEKGAFTGAAQAKAGLFEIASGGTLFLDEIGEIPFGLQAKLLKAVEEKRIRRVGGSGERQVETRIIAATSANLEQMVTEGRFRADLFDRLNILKLETVPLKFQKDKIKDLLCESLKNQCELIGRSRQPEISSGALQILLSYDWPGNFRELHNFAVRAVVESLDEKVISSKIVRRILGIDLDYSPNAEKLQSAKSPAPENDRRLSAGKIVTVDKIPTVNKIITVTIDLRTDDLQKIYLKAATAAIRHVLLETDGSLRGAGEILRADHSTLSRILTKYEKTGELKQFSPNQPALNQSASGQFAAAA